MTLPLGYGIMFQLLGLGAGIIGQYLLLNEPNSVEINPSTLALWANPDYDEELKTRRLGIWITLFGFRSQALGIIFSIG